MKLSTTTWVSVDGVMQGLGAADEDRRGRFERGGWAMPLANPEVESALNEVYARADAFLFGRWTYEVFAGSWGSIAEMRRSPIGQALNAKPKYVASTTLTDPRWADTTVISGDLAAAAEELKAGPEGELLVPGGGTLIRWLLENGLVDEINLFTAPVVIGQGTRLFPDTGSDLALELAESRATSNGVIIRTYRTNGPAVRGDGRHYLGLGVRMSRPETDTNDRPVPPVTDRAAWQARIDDLRVKEKATFVR